MKGKILLWLICLILGLPLVLVAVFFVERLLGYYPGEPGWSVARIAAEKNNVALCQRIIGVPWIGYLGPTTDESRMGCIHEYAKLTSDPSACELLMPGEYGFSCIGAAEASERRCTIDFGRVVEWGSYLDGTHQRATLEECMSGSGLSNLGRKCCMISKVANLRGFDDCSPLASERPLFEECLAQLALKTGNEAVCDPIAETGSRIACGLRAKYKSALSTLPPPLER